MPYISKDRRSIYNKIIELISPDTDHLESIIGDYNYLISKIIIFIIQKHGISYKNIALITGMLDNIKAEFYRRIVEPYEDKKIETNGDIGYEEFKV